jgi:hypothetical protein
VFNRKTPALQAAERKARWDRRVAQAAAIKTARAECDAAVRREIAAREAAEAAAVVADAKRRNEQGRPVRFWGVGVAVMDGEVFDTTGGLRHLGPLAGAHADVIRLPPEIQRTSFASQVILGNPEVTERGWVKITITVGGQAHQRLKRSQGKGDDLYRRLNKQSEKFNILARPETS